MTEQMPKPRPGRLDGKNSEYRSGTHRIPKRCSNEIEVVLQQHKDLAAHKEKKVGSRTQEIRRTGIRGFFSDLFYLGFKIESIHNLKEKHLIAVFNFLEDQGQASATLQNKISVMRVFCGWIGKNGMVRDSTLYVKDKESVHRSMVVKEDKSWDGNGIDVLEKLPEIAALDATVAIELELCWAFGLRVKEAIMFRPAVAHEGEYIWVREGTKGDRPRVIQIDNAIQKDVLERAKAIADKKSGFLGTRGKTLAQKRRRFYYVMEVCGITLREENITAHGLRHEYFQRRFTQMMGIEPPVRGGNLNQVDAQELHVASQKLMEEGGHTRVTITSSYYGSRKRKRTPAADSIPSSTQDAT